MTLLNVPLINISDCNHNRTLRALDTACRGAGVFHVVGHGIDHSTRANLATAMVDFFELNAAQKHAVARSENNHWGYYDKELTKNKQDRKEVYDYGPSDFHRVFPQWPSAIPKFRTSVESYYNACNRVALKLLDALASNLGVDSRLLNRFFQPINSSFLRLNHYPVNELAGDSDLGIHPHTDAGAFTLLMQTEQQGLEIFQNDDWKLVEPIEHALLVNLGDIFQVWSNDRYKAPIHRVIASRKQARYSAAYFFNPRYETVYQPLPSMIDANNQPKYRAIHWQTFRTERAKGDYRDDGHEIQISDFRL